uniref:Abnormal oocyte n=1 Tax=Drosophila melanogaster TaxID=7227 RepID=Q9VKM4_DROME|nr:abnormal oocyte [Drosophila melanogaster]AAF53040.1 abnormal oocyte [Drosophila melanogaster]|eukprot:NP_524784.1 abnormal oocyte [Drosophila melanogaster]
MAYKKRLQSQNLVHLLQNRESGYTNVGQQPGRMPLLAYERLFYKCITPCLTIDSITIPPIYLRKFTPDGRKLLAFSQDQRSLLIYSYGGSSCAAVGELIRQADVGSGECFSSQDTILKSRIFERLFPTKETLNLCQGDFGLYYLHREFSVFLEEGRYAMLAAMTVVRGALPVDDYVRYPDLFDKVDAFSYVFFLVDLKLGVVTDRLILPNDSIVIAHNHGISVFGSTVMMMSRLHQCVYVYWVNDGKFHQQETIGPRPRDFIEKATTDFDNLDATTVLPITHIKQRVLSFLYRKINDKSGNPTESQKSFYKNFEYIEHMIMERMHLVNNELLMLRYEERPNGTDTMPMATSPRRLYVFYTITGEEVVGVYPEYSVNLLQILLQFNDYMSNDRSLQFGDAPSLPMHFFLRHTFADSNESVSVDRHTALRFNPSVPLSSQSLSSSPYLKFNEFRYDSRYVSPLEQPHRCCNDPIVFLDRATDSIKFRLHATARRHLNPLAPRELCAFIWHPFDPLVLSIQKCMNSYVYHVHLYNHSTIVEK